MAEFEGERARPSVSNECPDDARTPLVKTRKNLIGYRWSVASCSGTGNARRSRQDAEAATEWGNGRRTVVAASPVAQSVLVEERPVRMSRSRGFLHTARVSERSGTSFAKMA